MEDIDEHLAMLRADKESGQNIIFKSLYVTPLVFQRQLNRKSSERTSRETVYTFREFYSNDVGYPREDCGVGFVNKVYTVELFSLMKEESIFISCRELSDFKFISRLISVDSWIEQKINIEFGEPLKSELQSESISIDGCEYSWYSTFNQSVRKSIEETEIETDGSSFMPTKILRFSSYICKDSSFRIFKDGSIEDMDLYFNELEYNDGTSLYYRLDDVRKTIDEQLFSIIKGKHNWASYTGEIVDVIDDENSVKFHILDSNGDEFRLKLRRPNTWEKSEPLVWYLSQYNAKAVSELVGKTVSLSVREPSSDMVQKYNDIYVIPKPERKIAASKISSSRLYSRIKKSVGSS